MIHKIKALYDDGKGISIRQIAQTLKISRPTVRKYLAMDEDELQHHQESRERSKVLDDYKDYIIRLLQKYPKLSAVKIQRKLAEKVPMIALSDRSFRRFVSSIKMAHPVKQERYYEPVLDMVPGVQCQVDLGEIRQVMIEGHMMTLYFAVFVLSYSRLMYVSLTDRPVDTRCFIQMHHDAFTYFDGVPDECVYDQTKLVVIREEFREVWFNDQFYRFATEAGFDLRICHGYDPESKGKVEAGVKYVKNNFFYGDTFESLDQAHRELRRWLDQVANERIHGTTKRIPRKVYQSDEQHTLRGWHPRTDRVLHDLETRTVDKVSLISHKSVKYSVPQLYQCSQVKIKEEQAELLVYDFETGKIIARHHLCQTKGETIRNKNHYRNTEVRISELEETVSKLLGRAQGQKLCAIIRTTSPKIYRDQLHGLIGVFKPFQHEKRLTAILDSLLDRPRLTVTFIRDYVTAQLIAASPRTEEQHDHEHPSIQSLEAYKVLQISQTESSRNDNHRKGQKQVPFA